MSLPDKIWLYRIVHWNNIEYILDNGMVRREHELVDENYVSIGMKDLIEDRHDHPINKNGAGNLGDYVPFYFGAFSPMLYLIKNGYQGVTKRPQEDIVYIISSLDKVQENGCEFLFTDMHAKRALCSFYDDIKDLDKIDWKVVKGSQWNDIDSYRDRRDRKQAEFLIRDIVPVDCIEVIGVKTKERQSYFQSLVDKKGLDIKIYLDTKHRLYY